MKTVDLSNFHIGEFLLKLERRIPMHSVQGLT